MSGQELRRCQELQRDASLPLLVAIRRAVLSPCSSASWTRLVWKRFVQNQENAARVHETLVPCWRISPGSRAHTDSLCSATSDRAGGPTRSLIVNRM